MIRKSLVHFLAQEIALITDPLARYSAAKAFVNACKEIHRDFDQERFFVACGVIP